MSSPHPRGPGKAAAPSSPARPQRHALLVRPGAAFRCFADGLCCSSIHLLGPVSAAELIPVKRLHRDPVFYDSSIRAKVFRFKDDGTCVFLRPDHLCGVHAKLGVEGKPDTCRKFPFALVATPVGRRVVTAHRCSCRTLGERPALTPAAVEEEIRIPGKVLRAERSVLGRISLTSRRHVGFATYLAEEAPWLEALAAGGDPFTVLGRKPFPRLRGRSWRDVAKEFHEQEDDSAYELAKSWFADAILAVTAGVRFPHRGRPWARFFDKAEARATTVRRPRDMYNDWLADVIWSFEWTDHGTFARARRESATRLAMAQAIAAALTRKGVRADRAAAEALMIIEDIGTTEAWEAVVALMPP